jgi:hypothetical protein
MTTILHEIVNTIMNRDAMITFLGFFLVTIGIFFSSTLLIILLPFLLLLIGVLKIYEINDKKVNTKQ